MAEFQKPSMYIDHNPSTIENGDFRKNVDDDGRPKRTGIFELISLRKVMLHELRV